MDPGSQDPHLTHLCPGEKASMMMAGPDLKETKKQEKAAQRKERSDLAKDKADKKEKEFKEEMADRTAEEEMLLVEDPDEDRAGTTKLVNERYTTKYNTMKIPNTALAAIMTDKLLPLPQDLSRT